jgi:L-ribulose-5-phosphate 4-epimerase
MFEELKQEIAQAVRTLSGAEILTLTLGHVSYRVPKSEKIVILGHTHKSFKMLDEVTEEDIIVMDFDGNTIEGKYEPPGEKYIHTEIYKRRPDVQSVIHGHPFLSMALGIANIRIVPVYFLASQFHPEVPILDYWGQIDTAELGKKVADALGDCLALILRGHGVVVTGESIEDASNNAVMLEKNAEVQLMASYVGKPVPITPLAKKFKFTSAWRYFVKKFDPLFGQEGDTK